MLRIGVTGGIGSGKSTVCNIFNNLGIPIFYSDEEGRKLLNTDAQVIDKVKKKFGKDMYTSENTLDRERMAKLVFSDPQALEYLSKIVHPEVRKEFELWSTKFDRSHYIINEAAILLETGYYKELDKIITVFSPKEERIERVMKRDGVSRQEVEKRMMFQFSDEERNKLADYIIMNEDRSTLLEQVMELHEILLNE